jgi:hypothetical protein
MPPDLLMPAVLRSVSLLLLAAALPCAAQWPEPGQGQTNPWQDPWQSQWQQGGQNQQGGTGGVVEWPPRYVTTNPMVEQTPFGPRRTLFPGVQTTAPDFRGFPNLDAVRRGFGAYPSYPGYFPPDKPGEQQVPPVGPMRAPGLWPSWLTPGRSDADASARAERAMLVRSSERVWYRPADEPVYVPLAFHDKIREVEAGAGVKVRTRTGELTLVFHDGATLRAQGMLDLEVRILEEAVADLAVGDVYRMWLTVRSRPLRLHLPDTSVVQATSAQVYLARDGERLLVRNYGGSVSVRSPLGTVDLPRTAQVQTLMTPVPPQAPALTLTARGTVRVRVTGRELALDGGAEGGHVEWLGARLQIGANATATIDALAGDSFPEYRRDSTVSQGSPTPSGQ